jgi:hypothetical protein
MAVGAVMLVGATTVGAPESTWDPPACRGRPTVSSGPPRGTWFRLDPWLEAGERRGQRLTLGGATGAVKRRTVALDRESFAAGPFGRTVLVGTDDGARSRLSLIDIEAACAWPVAGSQNVIRRATVTPDGSSLIEFRVDRASRGDLGVWRRPVHGPGPAERILAPIEPDARFGLTWSTEFAWSPDGTSLAVQSCGEAACRTRVIDQRTGRARLIASPDLGVMVGLTGDRLIVHGACRGLPCPLLAVRVGDGSTTVLDPEARLAVLAIGQGGETRVVIETGRDGQWLSVRPNGSDPRSIRVAPTTGRLVTDPARSGSGADIGRDWVLTAPDGRLPITGSIGPELHALADGRTVPFAEVTR